VYLDELPKSCLECACRNGEYNRCELITPEHSIGYYNEEEMDYKNVPINQDFEELECPLQSLADYNKQVRKEVCEEIRELTKDYFYEMLDSKKIILERDFIKVLDQIQGETK
jgi:hypothetical protein